MAIGDPIGDGASVADDATTDITPDSGSWEITGLESGQGKAMEVYRTADNGSNFYLLETLPGGHWDQRTLIVTPTFWLRLKNVSNGSAYNGYSGWVTTE